jgi:hypothetical protein
MVKKRFTLRRSKYPETALFRGLPPYWKQGEATLGLQ